jgi:hypothetical protein
MHGATVKIIEAQKKKNCVIPIKRSKHRRLPDDGFVKPKRVGALIVIFNVNFYILKQFNPYTANVKNMVSS